VRVSVRQQGGLLGVDQTTEVAGSVARLHDRGAVTVERRLGRSVRAELARLSTACAPMLERAGVETEASDVPDAMTTTVEIDDGGTTQTVTFRSGDDVPAPLLDLVAAVLDAPYRDPGSRWPSKVRRRTGG
jgi:hypothetical protein